MHSFQGAGKKLKHTRTAIALSFIYKLGRVKKCRMERTQNQRHDALTGCSPLPKSQQGTIMALNHKPEKKKWFLTGVA
eukprot:scaffold31_cov334-Pavlova_lutheri.AAC.9